ncbi:MAG TPA: alpha/beta hydrolase [Steroidobacteraceae bacterium]|nr:alpha/beta hydrolase [Steroidobacteraceae bacterium]
MRMQRLPLMLMMLVLAVGAIATLPAHAAEPGVANAPVLDDRYPERRVSFPGDVVGLPDLAYASLVGYRPLILDLYKPSKPTQPLPLVIYLHGGGWQAGHTRHSGAFEDWPGVLASIAARGYVVASVEYRLSGEAPFPAAVQDVKAAIRWLRTRARDFGIDKERAVVWGGSAGGQLAALVGATCGVGALEPAAVNQRPEPGRAGTPASQSQTAAVAESDCVQGVVAWYGVFDFSSPRGDAEYRYLGCGPGKCSAATLASAGAITYVDAKDPPVLMIHGVDDHTVPIAQSRSYLAALRAKGVKGELVEIPGVDHSFIGESPKATREASLRALNQTLAFIDATLKDGHDRR